MKVYIVLLNGCGECEQSAVLGVFYSEAFAEECRLKHGKPECSRSTIVIVESPIA